MSDPQSGEASGPDGEASGPDGEMSGEASGPDGDALRQELAANVVTPKNLPHGYQLEGPGEPGADADVPGLLGGPGINIVSEDEDEPGNQWSEHPR